MFLNIIIQNGTAILSLEKFRQLLFVLHSDELDCYVKNIALVRRRKEKKVLTLF